MLIRDTNEILFSIFPLIFSILYIQQTNGWWLASTDDQSPSFIATRFKRHSWNCSWAYHKTSESLSRDSCQEQFWEKSVSKRPQV